MNGSSSVLAKYSSANNLKTLSELVQTPVTEAHCSEP